MVSCGACSEWQLVERFDGRGGVNLIFHCHFCGEEWHTTVEDLSKGAKWPRRDAAPSKEGTAS